MVKRGERNRHGLDGAKRVAIVEREDVVLDAAKLHNRMGDVVVLFCGLRPDYLTDVSDFI